MYVCIYIDYDILIYIRVCLALRLLLAQLERSTKDSADIAREEEEAEQRQRDQERRDRKNRMKNLSKKHLFFHTTSPQIPSSNTSSQATVSHEPTPDAPGDADEVLTGLGQVPTHSSLALPAGDNTFLTSPDPTPGQSERQSELPSRVISRLGTESGRVSVTGRYQAGEAEVGSHGNSRSVTRSSSRAKSRISNT